ncbi:MAG: TIGR02217 family protein [Rhizobiaceae bacterium]|nr:MAG: TIGR02217 family protein [Rhizobiaceae bacterium]
MTDSNGFHDVLFPLAVSFGATGGPERRNEIVQLTSGREKRNARFSQSRRHYDAGSGVRSLEDLYDVLAFFEARRGSLNAFRFRDPFDMKSCRPSAEPSPLDQTLGTGDGKTTNFPLVKNYGDPPDAYARLIRKPVEGTLLVAVAGVVKSNPVDFTFDDSTGSVVFAASAVPPAGTAVTAGYAFDVPVRFDAERIEISLTAFKAGQIPSIPLVEVAL